MGFVFEAVHTLIERPVALKVISPELACDPRFVGRFLAEACSANQIAHPSIVQVTDFGQSPEGTLFLAMELLRGSSLRQRLQESGGRLELDLALRICRQLAGALAAVHERSIVHRDIKPENIMLVSDAEVLGGVRAKLLDFGIARVALLSGTPHASTAVLTGQGVVMGTPGYMSPEQCRGLSGNKIDDKADVYSLGILLFEMVAGQKPFISEVAGDLLAKHIFAEPPTLAQLAPWVRAELDALVRSMLRKDPVQRPSMALVYAELVELTEKQASSPKRPARASRVTVPLALLVAGIMTAAGLWYLSPPGRSLPVRLVKWQLTSNPTGADVIRLRDNVLLGQTPWSRTQEPQPSEEPVQIHAQGYEDQISIIDLQHSGEQYVVLKPNLKDSHARR